MASITDLMRSLIEDYALYDTAGEAYKDKTLINPINNNELRIVIFGRFSKLINEYLIQDGRNKIMGRYCDLMEALKIEPDKLASPELIWLEKILSKGQNDGICLKILGDCYHKQMNPEQFIYVRFDDISTLDDLRKWLKQLKEASLRDSSRKLYENLLTLLEQSEQYLDDVGQLKPKGIALLVSSIPGLILGVGAVVAAQELMAIYALFFVLLKGGKLAVHTSRAELKAIGNVMQNAGVLSATTTTTLLVYLMRLIVWASHKGYSRTVYASSAVLGVFKNQNTSVMFTEETLKAELRRIIDEDKNTGGDITNLQLRLIARPIEARLEQVQIQAFVDLRVGRKKREAMIHFLHLLKSWDKSGKSIEIKLEKVSESLKNVLEDNSEVNDSMTAIAIKIARSFLNYFIENPGFATHEESLNTEKKETAVQITPAILL